MSNLEEGNLEGTFWLVTYMYITTIQYLRIAIDTETEENNREGSYTSPWGCHVTVDTSPTWLWSASPAGLSEFNDVTVQTSASETLWNDSKS